VPRHAGASSVSLPAPGPVPEPYSYIGRAALMLLEAGPG